VVEVFPLLLPYFAVTLFVSAFLLFLVQPMIGKMILPRLGGTPQVWNTCMVFFQMALLAGYAYTHTISTWLKPRQQMIVHGIFLLFPLSVLFLWPGGPFNVTQWQPPAGGNPIAATLLLLASVVGLPFLVVSTTAPLLQKWFAYTGHEQSADPYFLYGASNLGSMLALLAYPFLIEPGPGLRDQAWIWAVGYIILAAMVGGCIFFLMTSAGTKLDQAGTDEPPPAEIPIPPQEDTTAAIKAGPSPEVARVTSRRKGPKGAAESVFTAPTPLVRPKVETVDIWLRLRWILLAAAPSSMMLGVTSYISIDLSPVPLFWVIPLAIYLATFIIVFSKYPVPWTGTPHTIVLWIQPFSILLLCYFYVQGFHPIWSITIALLGFFFTTMVCHGELARTRPSTKYLTEFYLWMSFGGMLGGVFNGLVAPVLFTGGVLEYPLAITIACILRPRFREDWADTAVSTTFPGVVPWFKEQGDNLAKAFGRPATGSPYLLGLALDVFFVGLMFIVTAFFLNRDTVRMDKLVSWVQFFGFDAESRDLRTREWGVWAVRTLFNILVYFTPLFIAVIFMARPLRFGLCIGLFLLANLHFASRDEPLLYGTRSYFGVLRVFEDSQLLSGEEVSEFSKNGEVSIVAPYNYLMHGTTHHGLNFQYPPELRRLATTYYHRRGPVGVVMEKLNWFPDKENRTYWADSRLPASLIGLGGSGMGINLPTASLVGAWSEPPYATIGLGTGTMASYGRPMGHVTFYEIDQNVRNFSLPWKEGASLPRIVDTKLAAAIKKTGKQTASVLSTRNMAPGMALVIDEGSKNEETVAVESGIEVRYTNSDEVVELAPKAQLADNKFTAVFRKEHPAGATVRSVYPYFDYLHDALKRGVNLEVIMGDARLSLDREDKNDRSPNGMIATRQNYYRVMEIDAFSSDAIPVHLITKESIKLYLDHLTEDGVICVHTSNRHLDLVKPVTDVAESLGLKYIVGKDHGKEVSGERGHFGSEYVMLARDAKYLPSEGQEFGPPDRNGDRQAYLTWTVPAAPRERIWTDDYSNLVGVLRESLAGWIMVGVFVFVVVFAVAVMYICKALE